MFSPIESLRIESLAGCSGDAINNRDPAVNTHINHESRAAGTTPCHAVRRRAPVERDSLAIPEVQKHRHLVLPRNTPNM